MAHNAIKPSILICDLPMPKKFFILQIYEKNQKYNTPYLTFLMFFCNIRPNSCGVEGEFKGQKSRVNWADVSGQRGRCLGSTRPMSRVKHSPHKRGNEPLEKRHYSLTGKAYFPYRQGIFPLWARHISPMGKASNPAAKHMQRYGYTYPSILPMSAMFFLKVDIAKHHQKPCRRRQNATAKLLKNREITKFFGKKSYRRLQKILEISRKILGKI